jgi:hypothetical protein
MALISRKPGHQESGEPDRPDTGGPDTGGKAEVQVTVAGPDAERLAGLIDMSAVAAMLRRRAAEADPPA